MTDVTDYDTLNQRPPLKLRPHNGGEYELVQCVTDGCEVAGLFKIGERRLVWLCSVHNDEWPRR